MTVRRLGRDDPDFPRELLPLENSEYVEQLFIEGDVSLLTRPRVAIIGSRHPSQYGIAMAYQAAKALAGQGLVIISGMAPGLDARAHRGALDADGGTIAVLGTGMKTTYPRPNQALLAEVRARGLVVTEFPAEQGPKDFTFPRRNRIIAALCQCLVVVEGRMKGGTSNTVAWALKYGRPIRGVPGHLGDPLAESPNLIIQDGGLIYLGPNDVLSELHLPLVPETGASMPRVERPDLTGAEATLFDLIGPEPVQVDALTVKSGLDHGLLLAALSSLELQGLITQLPGKRFALAS